MVEHHRRSDAIREGSHFRSSRHAGRRYDDAASLGLRRLLEQPHLALEVARDCRSPCTRTRTACTRRGRAPATARAPRDRDARSSPRARLRGRALSISAAIAATMPSSIGRFFTARSMPASSFSRSNGSLTPERFTTMTGSSSSRSYVVYRRPQARHSRRRRIATPSSAGRESTTLSSTSRQNGHRTAPR